MIVVFPDQTHLLCVQMMILHWACTGLFTFGLDMLHKGYVSYKVCSNDDPRFGLY